MSTNPHSIISTTSTLTTPSKESNDQKYITQYQFSGFEGPEKKLEIEFEIITQHSKSTKSTTPSLRNIKKEVWDKVLTLAKCEIISKTSNKYFDSYVLSESSLFVYDQKIMIKTCGTTTLLKALDEFLSLAKQESMEPNFIFYSRKNFVFPDRQIGPHVSWKTEVSYLDKYFDGESFVFGDPKKDHWNLYIADYKDEKKKKKGHQTIEILMQDLCPEKMKQFYKAKDFVSSDQVTKQTGIQGIIPAFKIDSFQFEPCGYSMNGLLEDSYSTIHITPEKQCSYVSYETNIDLSTLKEQGIKDYGELVRRVFDVFCPGKALVILYGEDNCEGLEMNCKKALRAVKNGKKPVEYKRIASSFHDFNFPSSLVFESFVKN